MEKFTINDILDKYPCDWTYHRTLFGEFIDLNLYYTYNVLRYIVPRELAKIIVEYGDIEDISDMIKACIKTRNYYLLKRLRSNHRLSNFSIKDTSETLYAHLGTSLCAVIYKLNKQEYLNCIPIMHELHLIESSSECKCYDKMETLLFNDIRVYSYIKGNHYGYHKYMISHKKWYDTYQAIKQMQNCHDVNISIIQFLITKAMEEVD